MAQPDVARVLTGSKGHAARIEGYALPASNDCFPLACTRSGAVLEGVIADCQETGKFDFFHKVIGSSSSETCDGARIYTGADSDVAAPWDAAEWAAFWGQIAPLAAAEIVEHMGRESAQTLAGRLPMVLVRAAARVAAGVGKPAEFRWNAGHDSVELLEDRISHSGFFLTRAYSLRHPHFDGGLSEVVSREVFIATDAAIVLPYDPVRDRVLMVEQFRMGPYGRGDARPWMLEPVAGRVDAGESPETTAHRECREEAGITLRALEHISSHYCSPGSSTEYYHNYIGLCDLPDLEQGRGGLDAEHEDIRTHVLSFEQAMRMLETGEADAGPLALILIWLSRERDRLRASA